MKHYLTKIISLLFIVAFLATNTGSLYGCISCDSGSLSETHIKSHLDDHSDHHVDLHVNLTIGNQTVSLDPHPCGKKDSCVDSQIQTGNGLLEDAEDCKAPAMHAILLSHWDVKNALSSIPTNNPSQLSSFRVPQTILFHRTIVLLS